MGLIPRDFIVQLRTFKTLPDQEQMKKGVVRVADTNKKGSVKLLGGWINLIALHWLFYCVCSIGWL